MGKEYKPWEDEPNEAHLEAHGFKCHIRRNSTTGTLCGYVSLPRAHRFYGVHYNHIEADVHGGLTYSGAGKDGSSWVVGFDTAHCSDYMPAFAKILPSELIFGSPLSYKTFEYVKDEVINLAKQLNTNRQVKHGRSKHISKNT